MLEKSIPLFYLMNKKLIHLVEKIKNPTENYWIYVATFLLGCYAIFLILLCQALRHNHRMLCSSF